MEQQQDEVANFADDLLMDNNNYGAENADMLVDAYGEEDMLVGDDNNGMQDEDLLGAIEG